MFLIHLFPPQHARRRFAALLLASAIAVAATGCGGGGDSTGTSAAGGTTAAEPHAPDAGISTTDLDPSQATTIPTMPDNKDPSAVQCTGDPQGVFDATAIVGDPYLEAEKAAVAKGCDLRVVERDGEPLAVTQDFRPDRVNVVVKDGDVTRIDGLY